MRTRLTGLCALAAPFLSGCLSTNTPNDFTFRSVEAVDWRNQAEMAGLGAGPLLGMVDERDLSAKSRLPGGEEKWHRQLLKIEFTSATDLPAFAAKNSYNLGITAFFCDSEKNSPNMPSSNVFWHGVRLSELGPDPIPQRDESARQPITYYIFFDVADEARPQDIPPREGFDLRQKPADVCFYARGGNELGRGYRSNTVIVPKAAIAAVLQKTPAD